MAQFQNTKTLVIGDIMIDKYWHGSTDRISPEAPVPVVHVSENTFILGGAGNVAHNIATLGAEVHLAGFCGKDESGLQLRNTLKEANITGHLVSTHCPTITKLRVMSQHQQLIRLDFEENFKSLNAAPLLDEIKKCINDVSCLILSDYNKGTLASVEKMIAIANQADVTVIIDPKGNNFHQYRGAFLLTPNIHELTTLIGECHSDEDMVTKTRTLIQHIGVDNILITRGAQGMTLVQANGESYHQPTKAKEVFDVTGAGDTVIATMGVAIGAGYDLQTAMMLANTAAGLVVGKMGTATISLKELNAKLHHNQSVKRGIVSREEAKHATDIAKLQGKTVVFTNGCFDILHSGHVEYLQAARSEGSHLIVAVNDDQSVKRLKGESRPILPHQERMAMLAALECVDWVIGFHEDNPIPLLELLKPNILVKGGDYSEEDIVGHEVVKANGGTVKPLVHIPGRSTTSIIESIQQNL